MFAIALFALFASAIVVLFYFWNRSRYFIRRGIPGPPPTSIFSGNLFDYQRGSVPHETAVKWEREYGETYGYMEGSQRVVITSNLDILNDVFNKKFEYFHARKPIVPFPFNVDKEERVSLFSAHGLRWKRFRTLMNPLFSVSKLKTVEPILKDSICAFVNVLEKSAGQCIDIYPYFQQLTLDIIERVAFGKDETNIGRKPSPLIVPATAFVKPAPFLTSWIIGFYVCTNDFQDITRYLHKFLVKLKPNALLKVGEELKKTINIRRLMHMKNGVDADDDKYSKDFIDFFLNAEASEEELRQLEKQHVNNDNNNNERKQHIKIAKRLTDEEIVAQSHSFLLAGFDTTAIALAYFVYELAMNDEIQRKLVKEIDDYFPNEELITYDSVQKLSYLDYCIKETLRLNPVASSITGRICAKTCQVGDGLVIEEGVRVATNAWSIHYNKSLWGDDADSFCPERWDPVHDRIPKHPMAYQPFGAGPRKCIGLRFALIEIKFAACFLLKKLRFDKCDKTKLVRGGNFTTAPDSVNIVLQKKFNTESD